MEQDVLFSCLYQCGELGFRHMLIRGVEEEDDLQQAQEVEDYYQHRAGETQGE